ncbi:MAG TPA: hypothetical protein VE548_15180, partial [Nitrososphaeraceae archaeon]|nr:hypothetical protein [Nitrososphaeraceae archaeon]
EPGLPYKIYSAYISARELNLKKDQTSYSDLMETPAQKLIRYWLRILRAVIPEVLISIAIIIEI